MYLLRRTTARAIISTPSKAFLLKPRSINTFTPTTFRSRYQQHIVTSLQRRWVSDGVGKVEGETKESETAAESFAQTVAEAPADDSITPVQATKASTETPVQESPQVASTDSSASIRVDALETAAQGNATRLASPRRDRGNAPPNKVLYVGNLYYEVTEDQIKRIFSRFGPVESVTVIYDNRGLSRGFAYVEYQTIDDAQSAIDSLDMQIFEGRNLVVQFHRPRPDAGARSGGLPMNPPSKTLFIGNMPFEMSDQDLNDLFRDIRNVLDVRVAIDRRTGQPRGFAHADFIDVSSALKAKDALVGKVLYGRRLRVDFSKPASQQQRVGPVDGSSKDQNTVDGM